ncbi:TetR/AcrR family transcriptional regulator [Agromyces endophyticus]|uniref:TetR/AcrR family transcriptional regulator n=1 Tax=Agromyces sp. H17E-10 TaxID=2932244 RepID=UPI00272E1F3D|nr:TetR/AcrR family transcriptional regulator [Agromyces sp. H17E-10]
MDPLIEPPPAERADAAANRRRILDAAERLFAERGPDLTMSELAEAAGVGRGTLYRRYPDVASVAVALLDEHERALQARLLDGPPPLGPGAAPADRLAAFYGAMVELLEQHLPLALGAEQGAARFATGAYGFWRMFVAAQLRQAGVDDTALPDVLLAPLAPEAYAHLRRDRGQRPGQVVAALTRLTAVLTDAR